jgi:hypothetical protein
VRAEKPSSVKGRIRFRTNYAPADPTLTEKWISALEELDSVGVLVRVENSANILPCDVLINDEGLGITKGFIQDWRNNETQKFLAFEGLVKWLNGIIEQAERIASAKRRLMADQTAMRTALAACNENNTFF